jgi:hypothetical protein
LEDWVIKTLVKELADLLELLVELGHLPNFTRLVFLDDFGGWLDFGQEADN